MLIFFVGTAFSCNLVCQQGQKRKMTTSNEAMIEENTFDANGNILQKTSSIQHFPTRTTWFQWKCHQKTSSIQHFPTRTAWFQLKCHQKYLFYSADICAPAFTFHMGQWTASACEVLMALPSGNSSIGYERLFCEISNTNNVRIAVQCHSLLSGHDYCDVLLEMSTISQIS